MPRVIDVSWEVTDGMEIHGNYPTTEITTALLPTDHGSHERTTRRISTLLHAGTHVDAPEHMVPGGRQLHEYAIETFVGPALIVDMSHKVFRGAICADDLEQAAGAKTREGDRLLIRTGWPRKYGYRLFDPDSPYLTEDASQWIVDKGVRLVGTDFLITRFDDAYHMSKKILLRNNVLELSNLQDLDTITKERVTLVALPLKIMGVEATMVRAIVIEDD